MTLSSPTGMQLFQSTCPRGARLGACYYDPNRTHFNPRAHEGHDLKARPLLEARRFQSTCPRGARQSKAAYWSACKISIHVPTRGTTSDTCKLGADVNFNPRAHEGHDLCSSGHRAFARYFNPRAHEGHDE